MFEIKGKIALITGGTKGLGLSYARELLKCGLKGVSLVDLDVVNGEKAIIEFHKVYGKHSAIFLKADVTNELEFEEAFEATIKTFNQLDIVINNAGIADEIQWRKCIEVNLIATITGSVLALEKYLPKFKSGNEGVLVNISSILGLQPIEGCPIYATTKHGIIGFSRSIGGPVHYEKYKVRVLTICPGATNTSLLGLKEEQQREPFRSLMNDFIGSIHIQSVEDVAQNVIPILQEAVSGSVWSIVKGVRKPVEFPIVIE